MNKVNENELIPLEVDEQELTLVDDSSNDTSSEILFEDTTKRSENVKHFRMKNGHYMAVVYDKPVHTFDKDTGKFVDIAHRFDEKEECFEAETDRFKARFPKKEGKRKFVTVEKDGRSVSWRYIPTTNSHKKHAVAAIRQHERASLMELPRFPQLKYEKTEGQIDLEYGITEQGVKENIVLAKRPKHSTFRFELKLDGLRAVLAENKKSIRLFAEDMETDEPEFIIPPINMTDAAGVYSEAAHYELVVDENNTVMEIVIDPEWLLAEERLYPVIVDPQINIPGTRNAGNMKMVTVCSDDSVVTEGDYRKVGVDSYGKKHRLHVQVPLPKLPNGFKITDAGVDLVQRYYVSSGNANNYVVYATNGWWSDDEKKWNNQPVADTNSIIDTFEGLSRRVSSPVRINLTNLVNSRYDSNKSTVEFVVQAPDAEATAATCEYSMSTESVSGNTSNTAGDCSECCTNETCQQCTCICQCKVCPEFTDFYSNTADSDYKAVAHITYMSEDTYSDHQKYHTIDNGRAGTGSINLFTGKLSYAHGDVMAECVKLPLAVSHVYRDTFVDEGTTRYGKGWRLSIEQTLEVVNQFGVKAVYTDAKGKRHYFLDTDEEKISDDAGLGLYFEMGDCKDGCEAYRLCDDKGNIMRFNAAGKLYQMKDCNGNVSTLTYSAAGYPEKIVDGSKNTTWFEYENGRLSKVIDYVDSDTKEERAILYSYDSEGHLTTITYPSPKDASESEGALSTTFAYDDSDRLSSITDMSGLRYTIHYAADNKVIKVSQSGTLKVTPNSITSVTEEDGGSISFEYRSRSAAIVDDKTKIKTVYRFDENGRELSSYEDLSEVIDISLRSESTRTNIGSYSSILSTTTQTRKVGKYRSLSASISGSADSMKNLLRNGCFTDGIAGWTTTGASSSTDGVDSTTYLENKKSYHFAERDNAKTRRLTQTLSLCDCQIDGNVLVASAWAKATNPTQNTSESATAKFCLYLKLSYENGEVAEYSESFDSGCTDWQYVAIPFVLDRSCKPVKVTYRLDFSNNSGECYFTNARLVATYGTITTNQYRIDNSNLKNIIVFGTTQNIRMISTMDDGILKTEDYQNKYSDTVCTIVTDLDGNTFISHYKYDDKHNLLKTEDYRGMVTEYTYDPESGKQLTQKTYHKNNPNAYMYSEVTYEDGHFLTSERDPRFKVGGKELNTTYEYDKSKGLLEKRTDTNGQVYTFEYDDNTDDLKKLATEVNEKSHENKFHYEKGYLTGVEHNGFQFGFSYDALGRNTVTSVAGNNLLTTEYVERDDAKKIPDSVITHYATGEKSEVITDLRGNPIEKTYTSANGETKTISTATYDEVGNPLELVDKIKGVCYTYTYNSDGSVSKVTESTDNGTVTNSTTYDKHKRVTAQTYGAVGHTYRTIYEKNEDGKVYPDGEAVGITLNNHFTDQTSRDGLGRVATRDLSVKLNGADKSLISESYAYLSTLVCEETTVETQFVKSISPTVNGVTDTASALHYTYNDAGNIETVRLGSDLLVKYYYDGLNRLVREDNYSSGKTYVWHYDVGGNITEKTIYNLTADLNFGASVSSFKYVYASSGWRDQLTSFNGEECKYDAMGNPTKYRGNTLTWTHVRRLASYGSNTYTYGADGIRTGKTVNNVTTNYTLNGSKILRETTGSESITYYYGGSGVIGFEYKGTDYYYRKNLQGDVIAIYNASGTLVAEYVYNAWGQVLNVINHTSANIGDINPFRYRGYYYDSETGLYYLNSRYYDPETGRFISSDTTEVLDNAKDDIGGLNLYAYCDNNPVSGRDDDGNMSFWKKLAIAAAIVVAVAVVAAVVAAATAATGGAAGAALCAVTSTFVGAAKGAVIGAVTGAVSGAVTGAVTGAVEGYQEDGWDGVLSGMGKGAMKGAVQGAQDGLLSGMVMGGIGGAMNPSFCFVAGTAVLTAAGHRAIEDIKTGDLIPCVDHITGERAEKRVVSTTVKKTDTLVDLVIAGETIRTTTTHPFQVKDKGWVDAGKLQVGDLIYDKDWNTAPVEKVEIITLTEPVEVYNFEVEDCHTYYVGAGCWLVHNLGCTQVNTSGVGQNHHPFSRKIVKAANNNPNLKGHVTRDSGTLKALTKEAHMGYQKWHRNFDNATVSWLKRHPNASLSDFTNFMNKLYGSSVATGKFGPVFFS